MEIRGGHEVNEVRGLQLQSSLERRVRDGGNNNYNGTSYPQQQTLPTTQNQPPSTGSNFKASSQPLFRYRECLRNHAASVGGSVFDGCGEFMPSGEEGTIEALKCAACYCHRNFHRKEMEGDNNQQQQLIISPGSGGGSRRSTMIHSLQLPPPLPSPTLLHHRYSMGLHSNHATPPNMVQPMTVAYGAGSGGTESSSEDINTFQSNTEGVLGPSQAPPPPPPPYVLSKKRFRTKFSQDQKDKMMGFAEKIGWRINKQDEDEVDRFCNEVGVKRQVFKVWMHNNKNVKKQQQQEHGHGHEHEHEREQGQQQPL